MNGECSPPADSNDRQLVPDVLRQVQTFSTGYFDEVSFQCSSHGGLKSRWQLVCLQSGDEALDHVLANLRTLWRYTRVVTGVTRKRRYMRWRPQKRSCPSNSLSDQLDQQFVRLRHLVLVDKYWQSLDPPRKQTFNFDIRSA